MTKVKMKLFLEKEVEFETHLSAQKLDEMDIKPMIKLIHKLADIPPGDIVINDFEILELLEDSLDDCEI